MAQNILDFWKTIDKKGVAKSIVKIYKTDNGQIEGEIHKILKASERNRKCTKCKGDKKGKPLEGLVIIEDLKPNGDSYTDGKITDPQKGKTYDCKMWLDENDKNILHVRGYWGIFYRTQKWKRVEKSREPH